MKFLDLVTHIAEVDDVARLSAGRLVQQALSLRNWIIGAGVVEFEQSGEDRAAYGERLLLRLADALTGTGCKGLSARSLAIRWWPCQARCCSVFRRRLPWRM
jgi:uncharacterized protein DUF1016